MAAKNEDPRSVEDLERLQWIDPKRTRENTNADKADTVLENRRAADHSDRRSGRESGDQSLPIDDDIHNRDEGDKHMG